MIKLSILIPWLPNRNQSRIFNKLYWPEWVEVLSLIDNKKRTLSDKRNDLINLAKWEYISFIDDDDDITEDYIYEILKAIEHNPDAICYKVMYQWKKKVNYSKKYNHEEKDWEYYRKPNDKMCIRKDLCIKVPYENIEHEDDVFWEKISKLINFEYHIDKVLYYYNFNADTSECQSNYREIWK
jgi:hypothetical protein